MTLQPVDLSTKTRTVLIVDDSASVRKLTCIALQKADLNLFECSSAEEGLVLLARIDVDLILSDLNMPGYSGIEFVRILREQGERNRFTPVVMLTTSKDEELIAMARKAGVSGWINKPFDAADLHRTIDRFLGIQTVD